MSNHDNTNIYDDLSTYDGEKENGLPSGYGTMYFSNGTKYCGHWKDGLFNGQGVFTKSDHSTIDGEWKNGVLDGYGTVVTSDGNRYNHLHRKEKRFY